MNGLYCVGQMSGAKRWDAATDTAAAGVWWGSELRVVRVARAGHHFTPDIVFTVVLRW